MKTRQAKQIIVVWRVRAGGLYRELYGIFVKHHLYYSTRIGPIVDWEWNNW